MAGLLAESFDALAAELPAAYQRMCARLAGKAIEIQVDEERFVTTFADGRALVNDKEGEQAVSRDATIVTSIQTIVDVMDARRSLAEAVLADEVEVVGALDRLVDVHAGLTAYVHGAVRCPSFPGLLRRFRAMSRGEPA